jgi:hypothetical protein
MSKRPRPKVSGWLTKDGKHPLLPTKLQKSGWKVAKPPDSNIHYVKCFFCGEITKLCGQTACLGCCEKMHGGWKNCAVYCDTKDSLVEGTQIPYELINLILRYAPLFYHCVKCGKKSDKVHRFASFFRIYKPNDLYECSMCLQHFHNACNNAKCSSFVQRICCSTCFVKHYSFLKNKFFI